MSDVTVFPPYEPKARTWMVPLDFGVAADTTEQAVEAVAKWLHAVVVLHHGVEVIRGWMPPSAEPFEGDAAGVRWTVSVTLAVDTVTPEGAAVAVNDRLAGTPGLPARSGGGGSPIEAWVVYGAVQPEKDELEYLIPIDFDAK